MKWIKCSDAMPNDHDLVIAYGLYDNSKPDDFGIREVIYKKGKWIIEEEDCYDAFEFDSVTHWMKMPEGPNESNTVENYPVCNVCCLPINPEGKHPSWCGK